MIKEKKQVFCHIFIKDSMFVLPKDRSRPIILIGPGTGVVPAIAFLEEKKYIKDN